MLLDAPSTGFVSEVGDDECRLSVRESERAVAVAERDEHARVCEPDDVGAADSSEVGEHARMLLDAPPVGLVPEVGDDKAWRSERAVAVAERRVNAGVAEGHDVRASACSEIAEEARMSFDAPPAGVVAQVGKHEPLASKVSSGLRDPQVGVRSAERDVPVM